MDWQKKTWGRTRCVLAAEKFERHELDVEQGGFCSLHYHRSRANRFVVVDACIAVWTFRAWDGAVLVLGPDNRCEVESGVPHMFQVLRSGRVIEDYYPDRGGVVDQADIVRLVAGGNIAHGWPTGSPACYDAVQHWFSANLPGDFNPEAVGDA